MKCISKDILLVNTLNFKTNISSDLQVENFESTPFMADLKPFRNIPIS